MVGAPLNECIASLCLREREKTGREILNESRWEEEQERVRERPSEKYVHIAFRVSKMERICPLGSTNFLTKFHGSPPIGP